MLIAKEENFGLVAAVLPFDNEAEVLARANNWEMGLAAYVYTRDLNSAMRLTDRLEYGMVAVNIPSREGSRYGLARRAPLRLAPRHVISTCPSVAPKPKQHASAATGDHGR